MFALNQSRLAPSLTTLDGKNVRVDNHDLSRLAMWASRTIQKHGFGTRDRHVEGSHFGLAVFEGDVTAVYAAFHWSASLLHGRLSNGMVSIAELELDHITHSRVDRVRNKKILTAAHYDCVYYIRSSVRPEFGQSSDRGCDGKEEADGLHSG